LLLALEEAEALRKMVVPLVLMAAILHLVL
jgi:hypothetical protein